MMSGRKESVKESAASVRSPCVTGSWSEAVAATAAREDGEDDDKEPGTKINGSGEKGSAKDEQG